MGTKRDRTENFLDYIPEYNKKLQFLIDKKGQVTIYIENKGLFNRIAQRLFNKPKVSRIHLDKMGNFIWPLIDGKNSIYDISLKVTDKFGDSAEPLYSRLVIYIRQLHSCRLITLKERTIKMEYWDIYDKNRNKTGRQMKRNDWCLKEGEYHITVLGVIARRDGKFLITKRVMTKAWAPGWWEVSGGAVQAGEEPQDAVLREIKEETGLDVKDFEGGYLFSYRRDNPEEGDNYFVDIFRYIGDFDEADLKLQEAETEGYMFATKEEIENLGKQGIFLHYDSIKQAFEI